ncbi:MAG TPA: 2-hydroxyacid dehydrogenase [Ktedonosporobacter sp.]|nr:2-hydroxyacid dehydrogenase [Ktedonosporobacter sp.]
MKYNVHAANLPYGHTAETLQRLVSPELRITAGPDVVSDCEILVAGTPSREQIQASPRLRALVVPWAGVPEATRKLMLDFPEISVHNIHHNALPVAEMAITLMLTAAKFVIPADRALRAGDWSPRFWRPDPGLLLYKKTALVLGYGAIGKHVASCCRGLGMRVLATRYSLSPEEKGKEVEEGITLYPPDSLHELLPQADVLLLCVPLTPETRGLIGVHELSLLSPQAILINVCRAQIVDEAALYRALQEQKLYAAGLDVWYTNPHNESEATGLAPSTYPFHEMDNVVMSPHRAGHAAEIEQLRMQYLADLLNEAAQGKPIPNKIDVEKGY